MNFRFSFIKFLKRFCKNLIAWVRRKDLPNLAIIYGSDKWGEHFYAKHYERHLEDFRNKEIRLLEIGIGGNRTPELGGGSLRMWRTYFRRGKIYGLDIHDKSPHNEKRILTVKGSQDDLELLDKTDKKYGPFDVIIDDGSHQNHHVITSFHHLFPKLKDGGIYFIEDTQTSYWPRYGGQADRDNDSDTMMGLFKGLVDGLNYKEFELPNYDPDYYDRSISAIHFYHNLVVIQKGRNDEKSVYN